MPELDLNNPDWVALVIGAARYYMGRRTIAVGAACDLLCKLAPQMPGGMRETLLMDIAERAREPGGLGDGCDKQAWERVRAAILEADDAT